MAVTLETPRLFLRPHTLADFEPWLAMFSDPATRRFLALTQLSPEEGWNRLLRYAGHWSLLGFGLFAVFEKAGGRFIGEVGHADFHRGLGAAFDPCPEAAWIFTAPAQGQGYASEATRAARDWLDAQRGPVRTVCIVNPANQPSLGLAAKLGYQPFDTCMHKDNPYTMLAREA